MRWLAVVALACVAACASATQGSSDAGPDLTVSNCDQVRLYSDCSAQCGFAVCIVGQASCAGTTWMCDCATVGPCPDLSHD